MTLKRILLVLSIAAGVAWAVLFRPLFMGGPASYVIVSGSSMEPNMWTGDLAIMHQQDEYQVGDVIAFMTPEGGQIIHRIVGGNAVEGFIPQGDNRNSVDDWRPKPEDIRGRLWLHLPGAGKHLLTLREPQNMGLAMAAIIALPLLATAETRTRRKRGDGMTSRRRNPGPGDNSRGIPPLPGGTLAAALGVSVALTLVFGGLGLLAFRQPVQETERTTVERYRHTTEFAYTVDVQPSTLYPDGLVQSPAPPPPSDTKPGEARDDANWITQAIEQQQAAGTAQQTETPAPAPTIYTRLAERMTVTLDYALMTELAADVSGTISAALEVRAGEDGWRQTSELLAPRAFQGNEVSEHFTIEFAGIQALLAQIEEETGFQSGSYSVGILPRIDLSGTLDGAPFEETYTPEFVTRYTGATIEPGELRADAPPATATHITSHPTEVSLGPLRLATATARPIAVIGGGLALAASAALAAVAFLGVGQDKETRIRTRYRSMLMEVEGRGAQGAPADRTIRVANFEDLVRLARLEGCLVLHTDGVYHHRYFVRSGVDTYEYVVDRTAGAAAASVVSHGGLERP